MLHWQSFGEGYRAGRRSVASDVLGEPTAFTVGSPRSRLLLRCALLRGLRAIHSLACRVALQLRRSALPLVLAGLRALGNVLATRLALLRAARLPLRAVLRRLADVGRHRTACRAVRTHTDGARERHR